MKFMEYNEFKDRDECVFDTEKVNKTLESHTSQLNNIANQLGKNEDGTDIELSTTDKTIKGAINEVFQSASNGKKLIAQAITGKGVTTNNTDTFQVMADNIGKITTGDSIVYSITNNLSNAINNNTNTTVEKYNSYSANITINEGYELDTVVVTMNGIDITSDCYSNLNISIEHVTGDIVITVTTTEIPPNTYTITNTLTQCTTNNSATTIIEGSSYSAILTVNTGYSIESVTVKMNNIDVTSTVYNATDKSINITNVIGNIIITAIAIENILYSFGVMSDIHIPSDETTNEYGINYKGITKFQNALAYFNDVDFVCITGDLVQTKTTGEQRNTEYTNFKTIVDSQDIPVHFCSGNHDRNYGDSDNSDWQTKTGREMKYSFTKDNDAFIFLPLSNTEYQNNMNPYENVLSWLEEQLELYNRKRIFLFMHFPIPGQAGLMPGQYYGYDDDSTEDESFKRLIEKTMNVHCFSGHTHYVFEEQKDFTNIILSKMEDFTCTFIHVPSISQPRSVSAISDNLSNIDINSQYVELYKVDVYSEKIVLHAINIATNEELYTYEINTVADYSKSNSINVSTQNITMDESTTATFTVSLENKPNSDVTVNLSAINDYISIDKTSIVFNESNYNIPITVTITSIEQSDLLDKFSRIHLTSTLASENFVNVNIINTTVNDNTVYYSLSYGLFPMPEGYTYLTQVGTGKIYCTDVPTYKEGSSLKFVGNGITYNYNSDTSTYYVVAELPDTGKSQRLSSYAIQSSYDIYEGVLTDGQYVSTGTLHFAKTLDPVTP